MIKIEYNKITGTDLFNCVFPRSVKENQKISLVWDKLKLTEKINELKKIGLNELETYEYVKLNNINRLPIKLKINLRGENGEIK